MASRRRREESAFEKPLPAWLADQNNNNHHDNRPSPHRHHSESETKSESGRQERTKNELCDDDEIKCAVTCGRLLKKNLRNCHIGRVVSGLSLDNKGGGGEGWKNKG